MCVFHSDPQGLVHIYTGIFLLLEIRRFYLEKRKVKSWCVSFLLLAQSITTDLVFLNNMDLHCHSSGGPKSEIQV